MRATTMVADIRAELRHLIGTGTICPAGSRCSPGSAPADRTIVVVTTAGAPGYVAVSDTLQHTVDNHLQSGGGFYNVAIWTTALDSSVAWKGVDIWWRRQISPAPATATFADVPTNAQFFAEIEAMAASGVTQGCTATAFCPDANVTRRQMAAFFARALGLYWPF